MSRPARYVQSKTGVHAARNVEFATNEMLQFDFVANEMQPPKVPYGITT
jgi:hypothetical protein